jgi:ribosome-associated heat shock protein Hsp15
MMEKVRIDKWLWAVRIFKSRSLATNACKGKKVRVNGDAAKPSQSVQPGDTVEVSKGGYELSFKVVALLEKRVSAQLAQPCYQDLTPPEEYNKYRSWFVGKASAETRDRGAGRPTKRERRKLQEYKQDDSWWEDI